MSQAGLEAKHLGLDSHSVNIGHMGFVQFYFGCFPGFLLLFCQGQQYNQALLNIVIDSPRPGNGSMIANPTLSVVSYSLAAVALIAL